MIVGYARTSTADQVAGLESQILELQKYGCERIYSEHISSVAKRPELESAIDFAREGDTFIVTKLDRLARSIIDVLKIVEILNAKKVSLKIMNLGIDTNTTTGKLMLTLLGGIAQFEREIMLERQREGIAKAKKDGKYKGRKPISKDVRDKVIELGQDKNITKKELSQRLGISVRSIYNVLNYGDVLSE